MKNVTFKTVTHGIIAAYVNDTKSNVWMSCYGETKGVWTVYSGPNAVSTHKKMVAAKNKCMKLV